MTLAACAPIAFVPTVRPDEARAFYEGTLGLRLVEDDGLAMVFRLGTAPGVMLRVVRVAERTAAPYTILGWEVASIEDAAEELAQKGVQLLRYPWFQQDERGVWTAPGGSRIAWFADPDGNTLSISQHG